MSGSAALVRERGAAPRWPFAARVGGPSTAAARKPLLILAFVYLVASLAAGSMRLDMDEFTFVREPYELLGGDYTVGYLRSGEYGAALAAALKAYYLYWKYRPLFSPIVAEEDKALFSAEEKRFGYVKPEQPGAPGKAGDETAYRKRLIVPEPDRFYAHGAGKPLLPALVNIPGLALVAAATRNGPDLLSLQYRYRYHPVFILVRLGAILAGLATLALVYLAAAQAWGPRRAVLAGALFVAYPPVLLFFPNIHHDAYMVPFLVLAAWAAVRERYVLAGAGFGLALAAKNTAIFLLPALAAFLLWRAWRERRRQPGAGLPDLLRPARAFLTVAALGAAVLVPFANPVSYAKEVLTPVSGREYDPRGEDVSSFTLAGAQAGQGERRASVRLLHNFMPWSVFLAFVLLGILTCGPRLRDPLVALSFFFLLMMFPHSLVFGQGLGYRSLMFAPFFCLAAVRLSSARWCVPAIALLAAADLLILIDPLGARG